MKKFRKVMSLVLALAMVFALSATAFAADDESSDYTITIENATIGQDYAAYKIFDATYDSTTGGVSYTISTSSPWLEVIQGEGGYADDGFGIVPAGSSIFNLTLAASGDYYIVTLVDGVQDWEVSEFFEGISFPDGVSASASTGESGATSTTVVLDVGEPGYYFVTTSTGSVVSITTAAPTATIIDKNETVGGDKFYKYTTDANGDEVDKTDIALGEELNFDITSNVPLYAGDQIVTEYQFTDTLGDTGLEIEIEVEPEQGITHITKSDPDSDGTVHYYADASLINQLVTLTDSSGITHYLVDGTVDDDEVKGVAYNVTLEFTDVREEEIDGEKYVVCGGFILTYYTYDVENYNENDPDTFDTSNYLTDLTIDIVYTTYVTDSANHAETNTASLSYWTTSFSTPTPNNPVPHDAQYSTDYMYDWDLKIVKVDGQDATHVLEGATFTLEGSNLKDVVVSTTVTYSPINESEMEEGVTYYYLTADGRYITTPPAADGSDKENYETYAGPYVRSYSTQIEYANAEDNYTVTGTTNEDGILIFDGLSAGTYTLTEIVAPDGYNLLDDPIEITVGFDYATGSFTADLGDSMLDGGNGYFLTELEDGELVLTIANNTGTELPSTGGMGTTWFYIIGAVLVCGAVVVLVTRRRVNHAA